MLQFRVSCIWTITTYLLPNVLVQNTIFSYPLDLYAPLQPSFSLRSLTSAVLSWTPSTESICITMYTITLTNITEGNSIYTYNTTTNTTSMTVSDLAKGAEYFFIVAGVDADGRVGEESVPSQTVRLQSQCLQDNNSIINIHNLHCRSRGAGSAKALTLRTHTSD